MVADCEKSWLYLIDKMSIGVFVNKKWGRWVGVQHHNLQQF